MKAPRKQGYYRDRAVDCEFELEPYVKSVLKYAVDIGWADHEALQAMVNLLTRHAVEHNESREVDQIVSANRGHMN